MRRKDREILDVEDIINIIDKSDICRLAMVDGSKPYVVPMNFGYEYDGDTLILYFHGAREGKKIDILQKNSNVCFEIDTSHELITDDIASKYGYKYESVIGDGMVEFIENVNDKVYALSKLMKHVGGENAPTNFDDKILSIVAVFKVSVNSFTGKRCSS